jgi:hypothetical protein
MRAMKTFGFKGFTILSCCLLYLCAHGQTFQVTTTADSGPGSLRDAMTNATAAGGGTIIFTNVSGMISLQSALPDISGTLSILGNGQTNVAINGYRTNRVFNVLAGAICNISDLTVQGSGPALSGYPYGSTPIVNAGTMSISNCFVHDTGSGSPGVGAGGIASSGSGLVLNKVVVSNNVAAYGAFSAYNVRATNCLFINNSENDGAPIGVGGDSVFSDTTFTRNSARLTGKGGGIWASGNLTLLNCNVVSNYGDFSAGGIYFNGNNLTISNCAINNNDSSRTGGIYATGTNIVILNSSILGNSASDNCGGIVMGPNGYLFGCTISSNWTGFSRAAGIAVFGNPAPGTVSMTNCTISGNSTTFTSGAGVVCEYHGVVQAVNCTIAFNGYGVNTTDYGPGNFYALNTLIANNGSGPTNGDFSGTFNSLGYNLVRNLTTNTVVAGSTNRDIYGVDPLLRPLRNNGGPTLTHALMRGSPAINAGTSTGAPLTDQRGIARRCGTEVDIGAFEYDVLLFTDISRVNATNIHLQVEGPPAPVCTFQASSNFLDWDDVFVSGSNAIGVWEFIDQGAANHPNRFYRAHIDN